MSVVVKRKRGRPRLDEPREINEFDLSLVHEFRKHPEFYDRTHPDHRNRNCTERLWQHISTNLNVTTNMVKTRMLQLRNRFSLEKRRVEAMQQQLNDDSVTSQWSLYKHLTFLGDYVKTRRPYNLPTSTVNRFDTTITSSEPDEEVPDDLQKLYTNPLADMNQRLSRNIHETRRKQYSGKQNITLQSFNDSKRISINTNAYKGDILDQINYTNSEKFRAFGKFLASSLMEIDELEALHLIEQFTCDLVKTSKIESTHNTKNIINDNNDMQSSPIDNDSDTTSQAESDT